MKNVRKLSVTVILTLILSCSAFAGDISSGLTSNAPGDISSGVNSNAPGDISSGGGDSVAGDISSGLTQFLDFLGGIILP